MAIGINKNQTKRSVTIIGNVVFEVNMAYSLSAREYANANTRYSISDDFTDELFERCGMELVEIVNSQEFPDPNVHGNTMIAQTWEVHVPSHRWNEFSSWLSTIDNRTTEKRGWFKRWFDRKNYQVHPQDNPFVTVR